MLTKLCYLLPLLFILGCVSSPPASDTSTAVPPVSESLLSNVNGPGDSVVFCSQGSAAENEACFGNAFSTCQKTMGVFWMTSDGYSLLFETLGLEADTGNCRVRMTAADSESRFFGQSSTCSISKSPADSEHAQPFFDILSINTAICMGTYVDAVVKTTNSI